MTLASSTFDADNTLRRAEAAMERRRDRSFGSARAAVEWHLEAGERMRAPNSMHPRTEVVNAATGERARIDVDGGRGGDLDSILGVVADIAAAVQRAAAECPRGMAALLELLTSDATQESIGIKHRVSRQMIGKDIRRAEAILEADLRARGIVA